MASLASIVKAIYIYNQRYEVVIHGFDEDQTSIDDGALASKLLQEEKTNLIISEDTSYKLRNILRKVVSDKNGTASLADKDGYDVGGKTGTAESYGNKKNRINTFISFFPSNKPIYTLFVMLENPKINKDLIYNYRGIKTKAPHNTSGWNSVYVAGKIIEKIGPILAINNKEFIDQHVVEKFN